MGMTLSKHKKRKSKKGKKFFHVDVDQETNSIISLVMKKQPTPKLKVQFFPPKTPSPKKEVLFSFPNQKEPSPPKPTETTNKKNIQPNVVPPDNLISELEKEIHLSESLLETMIEHSYAQDEESKEYTEANLFRLGIEVDHDLSDAYASVFVDLNSQEAYVVHRGTDIWSPQDIVTDIEMVFGKEDNNRFQRGKEIQEAAEKKYGSEKVITMGHSLGGRIAEKYGGSSKSIIALKPYHHRKESVLKNEIILFNNHDPVSFFVPRGDKQTIATENFETYPDSFLGHNTEFT